MSEEIKDETWKYLVRAATWHSWDSPVGLSLFLVALGVTAALIRYSFFGR
jgi:hypothetical protein